MTYNKNVVLGDGSLSFKKYLHHFLIKSVALLLVLLLIPNYSSAQSSKTYDVVVIGGTPAGIAAAIAAGRSGKSVILVEQAPVLGGTLSSGVALADDEPIEGNSGIFEEFRLRVRDYHLSVLSNDSVVQEHLKDSRARLGMRRWNVAEGQAWEPKTAALIYSNMVEEVPTISVRYNEVPVSSTVKNGRIIKVTTRDRDNNGNLGKEYTYVGKIFIDATYEGDVAAHAGVPFRIGREERSEEEPHAGLIYFNNFDCIGGSILPETILPGSTGTGDNRLQAFTFRFIAKDYGVSDHSFRLMEPPSGYNPQNYWWDSSIKPHLPNNKRDMLGSGDLAGYSTEYVLSDWERRKELERIYKNHELGWLYYIQTEGKSPQWGLPDDEFTDNGHWPYRLYVREGRRIEGYYTLTESDIHRDLRGNGLRGPLHNQAVAIGGYHIDSHKVQNGSLEDSPCKVEGEIHLLDVTGPYQIPYGVMVPKKINGLLVPVAISSTHVAMSSVRMEPVWSSLGQAAGVASTLAIDEDQELSELEIRQIQNALLDQGSLLFFYMDQKKTDPEFKAVQNLSIIGAVDGDENYHFRPQEPITLWEFIKMAIVALDLPISISAEHFEDVPRNHPGFKYIETCYDYSTRNGSNFFEFEIKEYNSWHTQPKVAFARPDQSISSELAVRLVSGLLQEKIKSTPVSSNSFTRGDAAILINQLREKNID